ncbi:MAG UNVERIFIED_CONTAM: hypothetical protein LVT10_17275 [Anaerolineae bacterium]
MNGIANFLLGLGHMNEHLAQFREVKRQHSKRTHRFIKLIIDKRTDRVLRS